MIYGFQSPGVEMIYLQNSVFLEGGGGMNDDKSTVGTK